MTSPILSFDTNERYPRLIITLRQVKKDGGSLISVPIQMERPRDHAFDRILFGQVY